MSAKDWLLPAILSVVWGGTVGWIVLVYRTCADRSAGGDNRVQPGGAGRSDPRGSIGPDRRGMAKWPCGLGCIAGMGLLNDIVPFTLFVLAQGRITAGLAAILNATTPLFTVIVAHLATGDEKAGPTLLAGLAIGFGGVVVTLSGAGATGDLWAKLACLGAALSYGLAGVRGRRFRRMRVAPMTTAFGPLVCSTLVLAPVRLLIDRPCSRPAPGPTAARPRPAPGQTPARPRPDPGQTPARPRPDPGQTPVLAMVGMAALSTALACLIFFRILAWNGATSTAPVTFLYPVSATVLGVGVPGEHLRAEHLAGSGLIALGLLAIDGRLPRWPLVTR